MQADLKAAAAKDFFLYHNDIFPGMLFGTKLRTMYFFRDLDKVGLSAPTHMAWQEGGTVKVAKAPCRTGASLSAPWIVVWFNGGAGWDKTSFRAHGFDKLKDLNTAVGAIDVPWLIILQHPALASLDKDGLSLTGQQPLGNVVMMPLMGSQKLRPEVTARWEAGLPPEIVQRAKEWTAVSRQFPLYAREDYQLDEAADQVHIRNTFDYLTIEDDWKTPPQKIAPIPPPVLLAWQGKWRVAFDTRPTDLNTVTHWGPYWAVKDKNEYTYTISGILKYMDEIEVARDLDTNAPGVAEAKSLLLERIRTAANGGADPRKAYSIDWGMGMLGAWMRATRYLPEDLKKQLIGYVQKEDLVNGHFLNPKLYSEVPVEISPARKISVLVARPGAQTYGDDLVKQTSRMPYAVWQYGYYSGDWATVKAKYEMVKKMYGFNLLLGWSCVGPEYTAEHAKISAIQGPIGLGRLAKQFNDQPTYEYAAYLLAKSMLNEWVWDTQAVPYATKNAPWAHNTDVDWIMYESHGYEGLQGLPMAWIGTYDDIPLVLDRFNREELQSFNDSYVRLRHKYFPDTHLNNAYISDFGDATDLKALLSKPATEMLKPEILKKQSHLQPVFYDYPIDVMELAAKMSYQRLHPKGTAAPTWHHGLDSLSRGQSWRQMGIALRKDWADPETKAKNPWPYPAWFMIVPPGKDKAFRDDALPFGYIACDLKALPKEPRQTVRSNWNSIIIAWDMQP